MVQKKKVRGVSRTKARKPISIGGASNPAPSVRNGGLGVSREEVIKSCIQQWNDKSTIYFSGK